ncbi:NACHT domain-containing protein [Streptomyces olivochromogenes]|uniref:NACHT domain-containing protein n=1 Tax=Streptomyces olivochromogenes TaxID=1963 RepID=UPI001F3384CA|nr:NACHT domain-containing protein [Streptomyces olivochromogenes]MCF3131530.1 NACHT domain-containing protein [Streptomyces olivochromogenes]
MSDGGGRRAPGRVGTWYLLLVLVGGAGALAIARHFDLSVPETAVTVLMGLAPAYIAWAAYRAGSTAGVIDLDTTAGELAVEVKTQWDNEPAVCRVLDPYPLPVAWRAAEAELAEPWPLLTDLAHAWPGGPPGDPARWPADAAGLAGAGGEIGEVFGDRVPTRRLVVLGDRGAGKSVLLIRLLQDLIERRTTDSPVPVLFSLASWDPSRQGLMAWLADQLRRTYPRQFSPAPRWNFGNGNARGDLARTLLDAGRILPLLDGFDELPPDRHATVLYALNRSLAAGQPLVLASRADAYRAVLNRSDLSVRLNGAAAIHLQPLSPQAAVAYLHRDAGGPDTPPARRWDSVVAQLGTSSPVSEALSTPLGLFLACTIYNPHCRADSPPTGEGSALRPDELCDADRFPDRAAIDTHLFRAFIPAAYTKHPENPHPPRWSSEQALRTFVFLARFLESQRQGIPDLAWWELPRALPLSMRYLTATLAGGLASGIAFGMAGRLAGGVPVGVAAGVLLGIFFGHGLGAPSRVRLRWSRIGIALGVAIGMAFGLAGGVAGGIAGGIVGGHRENSATVSSWLRWSPSGIVGGLTGGLAGGLAGSLTGGLAVGAAIGIAVGVAIGISFGHRVGSATPSTRLRWSPSGIAGGTVAGVAGGAAFGFAGGIASSLLEKIAFGIVGGVAGGIAFGIQTEEPEPTSVVGPAAQFALDRRAFVVFGLAFGLAVGVAGGVAVGVTGGIALGLAGGMVGGLSQTAWAYFVVARVYLTLCHGAPRDLMAFMQDAHEHRGVLRQVGAVYQFRHIELQRHLAR